MDTKQPQLLYRQNTSHTEQTPMHMGQACDFMHWSVSLNTGAM